MKKVILTISALCLILGVGFVFAQDGDGVLERIANTLGRIEIALTGSLGAREYTPNVQKVFDGVATSSPGDNIAGGSIAVQDYRNIVFQVCTYEQADMTIKFAGTVNDTIPKFASSSNATNTWDYVESVDLEDGTFYDGDDGLVITVDECRNIEANTNGLNYITAVIDATGYSSGTIDCLVQLYGND